MKINSFNIDTAKMTVTVTASGEPHGPFLNVSGIKIHGHENKTLDELDGHAREEARKALRAAADAL